MVISKFNFEECEIKRLSCSTASSYGDNGIQLILCGDPEKENHLNFMEFGKCFVHSIECFDGWDIISEARCDSEGSQLLKY